MKLRTFTIDLAKTVLQACDVSENMKTKFNTRTKGDQLNDFMRQKTPTKGVMEACYSSDYWGREMAK